MICRQVILGDPCGILPAQEACRGWHALRNEGAAEPACEPSAIRKDVQAMAFSQRRRQTSSRSTPPHRAAWPAPRRRPTSARPFAALRLEPLEGRSFLSAQPPFLLSASLAAAPAAADDAYIASQHGQLVVDAADGVLQNDTSTAASAGRLLISSFGADNDLVITARSAGAAAGNLPRSLPGRPRRQRRSLGRIHARSWRRVRPARCPPPDARMGTGGLLLHERRTP